MLLTQLLLTVLKISLINVGKIGCMSREKYKQTIFFSRVVSICFSPVFFFLSVFWATCVRSVCVLSGFISGAEMGPYPLLGWSILVVIFSHRLLSQEVPYWVFSGVINAPLWSNVISEVLQWREKYIVCFIWYLYC